MAAAPTTPADDTGVEQEGVRQEEALLLCAGQVLRERPAYQEVVIRQGWEESADRAHLGAERSRDEGRQEVAFQAFQEGGREERKEVSHLEGRVAHQEATCLAAAIRRMVVAFAEIQVVAACWKMISFRAQWEYGCMDLPWWERHSG